MSENYEFIENIGSGMYGEVYKALNKSENKYYAIKRLNFKDISDKEKNSINKEVSILQKLNHPNILSYKD
jgi:serine/threonine protein kinase